MAFLAGVLAGISFQPLHLVWLLPVGVAAVTLAARTGRPRAGALVGAAFGTAFMLTLLPWLHVVGVDAWVGLSVIEGLGYALLGLGVVATRRLPGWPLWAACMWVLVELVRGSVPWGGFPWGRLAFATVDTPVAPLSAYVGVAGTSFAVALTGTVLAWACLRLRSEEGRSRPGRGGVARTVLAVAVTALVVSVGALVPQHGAGPVGPGRDVRVATVQGNVPGTGLTAFAERRAVLDNHVEATRALAADVRAGKAPQPDMVIWPESSTDIDPFTDPSVYQEISAAVDDMGVPVLVGAMVGGKHPHDVYNQGIVWSPGSGPGQRYSKQHPVPFGEYIPLRDELAPYIDRLDQIPRDMVPGTKPGLLDIAGTPVGEVICFEIAYDDLVRAVVDGGAGFLVVQTNNATYIETGEIEQQFAISRLRAIETGRYVVIAATDGISAVVAPDGSVVSRAAVRTQQVLLDRVTLATGSTPGVELGGYLEAGLVGMALLACVAGVWRERRRRAREARPEPGLAPDPRRERAGVG